MRTERDLYFWDGDFNLQVLDGRSGATQSDHVVKLQGMNPNRKKEPFDTSDARISPDAKTFVMSSSPNFQVFDAGTGKERFHFTSEGRLLGDMAISVDSRYLLTSGLADSNVDKHPVALVDLRLENLSTACCCRDRCMAP